MDSQSTHEEIDMAHSAQPKSVSEGVSTANPKGSGTTERLMGADGKDVAPDASSMAKIV